MYWATPTLGRITLLILKRSVCTSFNTSVYAHIPDYTTGMYISNTGLVLWIYVHTYMYVCTYTYIYTIIVYMLLCIHVQEFKKELEEEHKRELALLEAKLNQQMKHKLKVCTPCFVLGVVSCNVGRQVSPVSAFLSAAFPEPRDAHDPKHGSCVQTDQ